MQCAVCKFENEHIFEADWFWHMLWISLWRLNFSIYAEWSSLWPLRTSLPWKPCSKTCKKAKCPWRRLVRCGTMVLGVLAVFFDPFGHRAYQHFDFACRSGCQERPWAWRMQTSSFVANLCGSAHLWTDQGDSVLSGSLFVGLFRGVLKLNGKNQIIRRMPFAGEWWFFWSWNQEKLRHAGRAAYGFAEWALWQEIQAHKPLCLHICHCSFQKFGAVLMTQRWGTNSKGKGQASLFWASLFEGIHSVHRDTNSHW